MKKSIGKIISLLLCACLAASMFAMPVAASVSSDTGIYYSSVEEYVAAAGQTGAKVLTDSSADTAVQETAAVSGFLATLKALFYKFINILSNLLINDVICRALSYVLPASDAVEDYDDFDLVKYGNFYEGTGSFVDEPQENAVWSLGYSEKSIMPEDFGEKAYAKGAYLPYIYGNEMYKDDDGASEELRVRVIVLNDGSSRGSVVFAVLDCMGIANADVRLIREALADFAEANNIVSINISATHIHTGIDSQGVWTNPAGNALHNMGSDDVQYGVDRTFLKAMVDGTAAAVKEAYANMTEGSLYYSSMDISSYVWDRTAPIAIDTNLYKLEFRPFDTEKTPTIIATFGCHPESSSYDWKTTDENGKTVYDKKFSSDFIWYMEKVINSAGYNFLFIQGDVCTATSGRNLSNDGLDTSAHDSAVRYGYEMGYIVLGMNKTTEERKAINAATGDRLGVEKYSANGSYTVWYNGLATAEAEEVACYLNIASKQFIIQIENYAMAAIGKVSVADNLVLSDHRGSFYTVSEVGYMELGDTLKVYLSPGETFGELLLGGDGLKGFPYASIRDTLGENTIIFDLMNDAAGYVANDANFVEVGFQYNPEKDDYDSDTWCIISYGKHTGSTLIGQLYSLVDSVR